MMSAPRLVLDFDRALGGEVHDFARDFVLEAHSVVADLGAWQREDLEAAAESVRIGPGPLHEGM